MSHKVTFEAGTRQDDGSGDDQYDSEDRSRSSHSASSSASDRSDERDRRGGSRQYARSSKTQETSDIRRSDRYDDERKKPSKRSDGRRSKSPRPEVVNGQGPVPPGYYGPGSLAVGQQQGLVYTGAPSSPHPQMAAAPGWYTNSTTSISPLAHGHPSPARAQGPTAPLIFGPGAGSPMHIAPAATTFTHSGSGHTLLAANGNTTQHQAQYPSTQQAGYPSASLQSPQRHAHGSMLSMPSPGFNADMSGMSALTLSAPHSSNHPHTHARTQQHQHTPASSSSSIPGAPSSLLPTDSQTAMLFNATTNEVIVADLRMLRELQRQGHMLVGVDDAYRSQIAALQALVNGPLMGKREALMAQHARLSARLSEVSATRAALEREIAVLAEEMVGRLRSAESLKLALLAREQAEIERELEALHALVREVASASAAGVVPFLHAAAPLQDACSRLVAKPFAEGEVAVSAADLPTEARGVREREDAHAALGKLLAVKDGMIGHLLAERAALQEELASLSAKYTSEVGALEAQAQDYYDRLQGQGRGGQAGSQPQSPER